MISYETLALSHKRMAIIEQNKSGSMFGDKAPNPYVNYNNIFSLLLLNASIIEGALRSLLSQRILNDIDIAIQEGKKRGQTKPSKPEEMLSKFHSDIEMQGGWEKIKEQYSSYFDVSLDDLMADDLKESINTLFTLRNILAHGTAIIEPNIRMDESMKDLYPYNWQRKLQKISVYLKREFKNDSIFDNLVEHELPEHFLNKTKELFKKIEGEFNPIIGRPENIFKVIESYSFGYRHST
jgi:hypothetical protein